MQTDNYPRILEHELMTESALDLMRNGEHAEAYEFLRLISQGLPVDPSKDESAEDEKSWPKLSEKALPGLVGIIVEAATKNSEADPAAVLATLFVRVGIEVGAGPHLKVGETIHPARINAVIVGDSSKARKGTSAGPIKAIFGNLDPHCRTSPGPLSSGEGIIFAVRDAIHEWKIDKKSGAGEWQVTDPGIEDKRLFVLDEEFANALHATKREGNTLSSILRCLWDDGNAEPLTKGNRIKTTNAHVGIVTHITSTELTALFAQTEMLNGFGNRFLWVCSRRSGLVPFPEPIPEDIISDIRFKLNRVLSEARRHNRIELTSAAKELWLSEYPQLSAAGSGAAGCITNRGEAQTLRLALIYALMAGHASIELVDLEAGLAFWRYCLSSAQYIFGSAPSDRRKVKIIEALKSANGCLTREEIRAAVLSKHTDSATLSKLLTEMESEQIIRIEKQQTGGAPRHNIYLNHVRAKSAESAISAKK